MRQIYTINCHQNIYMWCHLNAVIFLCLHKSASLLFDPLANYPWHLVKIVATVCSILWFEAPEQVNFLYCLEYNNISLAEIQLCSQRVVAFTDCDLWVVCCLWYQLATRQFWLLGKILQIVVIWKRPKRILLWWIECCQTYWNFPELYVSVADWACLFMW